MNYSKKVWAEFYPDPEERAEAEEEMKTLAENYNPCAVDYDGEPGDGFSIKVIDQSGGVNDFWIDLWLDRQDVCMWWNDIVINTRFSDGQWRVLQQRDETIWDKAFETTFEYAKKLGLIVQLPNGDWRYANPDEYAVRRDAIVSLARKAKANQSKGVGKLTGRFRF